MFIQRTLDLELLIQKKSHFLFGPRGVGKSSLIKQQLGDFAFIIDLLHPVNYFYLKPKFVQSHHPMAVNHLIIPAGSF